MKKILLLILLITTSFSISSQTTFYSQGFEDSDAVNYSLKNSSGTSTSFANTGTDYITRANPATLPLGNAVSGFTGKVIALEDIDGAGFFGAHSIDTNPITINNATNLNFKIRLAAARGNDGNRYESGDFLQVQVSFDGGAFQNIISTSGASNGKFYYDSGKDGVNIDANDILVSQNSQEISVSIASTGTSIIIRVLFNSDGSHEELLFDDLLLTGTVSLVPPSVTTSVANTIGLTSATLGGNVTSDGGATVTERGVVYAKTSENANPLIAGTSVTKNTNGSGNGVFSENITGLAAGTQYSFKAYAINSQGTSYGNVVTFTTTGKGWTGATNTDWANASNWSPNSIPIASDNLVIPDVSNKPIISSNTGAVANNITIDAGSSVTVESGGSLIIDGTATVNGDFIYKVNVADTKWHLVSSPVAGEQFDDTWNTANNINTNLPNEAVSTYINTSDADGDWVYFQNGGGATTFGPGIGYSMQKTSAGDYTFIGTFPTPPINPTITASNIGNANENRWTLVGNPFPAHINIDTFLAANTTPLTNTHESVYVWNAATSTYDDLTTGFIHPGQGFFVNSNVASTSVTLTKAMQSDQNGLTFYKKSNPKITLFVSNDSKTKSTIINYFTDKTTGLDPRFDVGTFTGQSSSLNIYSHLVSNSDGVDFKRQALPDNNYENMIIPIGVNAAASKEITFTVSDLNLPADIKVFLEDRETNTFARLDEANSNYKITPATTLNGIGRFYLHTSASALSLEDISLENVSIYKTNNSNIRIVGLINNKLDIKIFNLLGKQVLKTSLKSNGVSDVALPKLVTGVYIVQLQTNKGQLNKKIILE